MADTLNFGEAVRRAGVSRHRLNEAIKSGRLPAIRGGGPGKPTTIELADLQAWCTSEGLAMPVETGERLERLPSADLVTLIRWMDQMATAIARVEATLERLERSERLGHVIPAATNVAPATPDKAAIQHKLRALQAEGFSLQAMADRFNAEGIPTLSGKGRWQKGTIGKLLRVLTT